MAEFGIRSQTTDRITWEETQEFIKARKRAKYSQAKVAELVGVTRQSLYNWEHIPPIPVPNPTSNKIPMPREVYNFLMDHFENNTAETSHDTAYYSNEERVTNEQQDLLTMTRERNNVRVETLAEFLGVSTIAIGKWESGFYWEPNIPKAMYDKAMDYCKHPPKEAIRARRRAADYLRITDEEQAELTAARSWAGVSTYQAGSFIGRSPVTISNWEDLDRANAPRDDYDALMDFYSHFNN